MDFVQIAMLMLWELVQGEVYKNDTIVYVRSETTKATDSDNDHKFWVARILQVRAENAQNVYALVRNILDSRIEDTF